MGDDDAARGQHILDHAQAEREAKIEPDRVANHFGGKAVAAIKWIRADLLISPVRTVSSAVSNFTVSKRALLPDQGSRLATCGSSSHSHGQHSDKCLGDLTRRLSSLISTTMRPSLASGTRPIMPFFTPSEF